MTLIQGELHDPPLAEHVENLLAGGADASMCPSPLGTPAPVRLRGLETS
ncbi:hypothetical protein ABTX24_24725 [Nocardioides sp. NPDC127514]